MGQLYAALQNAICKAGDSLACGIGVKCVLEAPSESSKPSMPPHSDRGLACFISHLRPKFVRLPLISNPFLILARGTARNTRFMSYSRNGVARMGFLIVFRLRVLQKT